MRREADPSWFQRFILPSLAFKAVVIGGGYATGRELVEFFLPAGPWGGLAGMLLAALIWSVVAALTFEYARMVSAYDYRSFFSHLLGPGWIAFEIAYLLFVALILAVFGAAAGSIGQAVFGAPPFAGTLALAVLITAFATFGNESVERLFKYVSFLLYVTYAVFLALSVSTFGDRITSQFAAAPAIVVSDAWIVGGITYASYNIVGAVVVLPVVRHLTRRRDALIAGAIAGPVAMAPAILFFVCMIAFYPAIGAETLPADFLLRRLNLPIFHLLFQCMIFSALLESGTGCVHAVNERIASARLSKGRADLSLARRLALTSILLLLCMLVADRVGFITLIASGYRVLAAIFLVVYVVPVLTLGALRLYQTRRSKETLA
ncbi:putative membrane protein YkvI [Sphingomonas sp. UYAg733]